MIEGLLITRMYTIGHEPGVQPSLAFLRSYKIPRKAGNYVTETDNIPSVSGHDFRHSTITKAMPKAKKKTKGTVVSDTKSEESGQLSQRSSSESSDTYDSDTSDLGTEAQQAEVQRDDHRAP